MPERLIAMAAGRTFGVAGFGLKEAAASKRNWRKKGCTLVFTQPWAL